ncbi:unnamed protein product [Coffea canephora]|uniref:Uncharacterized protein n=1 Tax=Coffea canephora TaxID=49390 RepID=A0A068TWX1_COFCA|nr:unnamed protein product [Coffea canephora]
MNKPTNSIFAIMYYDDELSSAASPKNEETAATDGWDGLTHTTLQITNPGCNELVDYFCIRKKMRVQKQSTYKTNCYFNIQG